MAGHKVKKTKKTLDNFFTEFMGVKEAQGIGLAQNYDYCIQVSKFIKASHNSTDYDLLNEDVLSFFSNIPNTSPAIFNKPYNLINSFLNWLVKQDYIDANPIEKNEIKRRVDEGNIKPVDLERLKTFIDVIPDDEIVGLRNKCITYVILDTGIRTSEVLRIHNNSLDLTNKAITLEQEDTKTKKGRILNLTSATCTLLKKWMEAKDPNWEDWLFPSYEGKRLRIQRLDVDFKKYSEQSGTKITPYQLRHTFASMMVEGGCDVFSLQQMMGHSNIKMTKRYVDLQNGYKKQQHDAYSPINKLAASQRHKKIKNK